jgi:hypothetical protein
MKPLKVATLTVLCLACGAVSCSSTPSPPQQAYENYAPARSERGILAFCLPRPVATHEAAVIGAARLQQQLKLEIHLPLRNQAELTQLLRELYDVRGPRFHKYLSVSEFTERYGPTAGDYNKVAAWAKSKGFTVTATTPNRRLVAVQARWIPSTEPSA